MIDPISTFHGGYFRLVLVAWDIWMVSFLGRSTDWFFPLRFSCSDNDITSESLIFVHFLFWKVVPAIYVDGKYFILSIHIINSVCSRRWPCPKCRSVVSVFQGQGHLHQNRLVPDPSVLKHGIAGKIPEPNEGLQLWLFFELLLVDFPARHVWLPDGVLGGSQTITGVCVCMCVRVWCFLSFANKSGETGAGSGNLVQRGAFCFQPDAISVFTSLRGSVFQAVFWRSGHINQNTAGAASIKTMLGPILTKNETLGSTTGWEDDATKWPQKLTRSSRSHIKPRGSRS